VATGRDTKLTGAVGEFLVAAELCRRGVLATPFAGNVPHYDIIASGQWGGHLPIQVKAINGTSWQFDMRRFVKITRAGQRQVIGQALPPPYPGLHVVLVALRGPKRPVDRFFILRWAELRDLMVRCHREYLGKHHGVRPRNPDSFHAALSEGLLERFEQRWDILNAAISRPV